MPATGYSTGRPVTIERPRHSLPGVARRTKPAPGGPGQGPGHRGVLLAALAAGGLALGGLGGCDAIDELLGGGSSSKKLKPAPYTTTEVIDVSTVNGDFVNLQVNVPEQSLAIGLSVQGSGTDFVTFIEHEGTLLGGDNSIRDPSGSKAPLAFNQILGDDNSSFFNEEIAAVHFPNDGQQKNLKAGTWEFPIGAADATDEDLPLIADDLMPILYYKTETGTKPTLKLNVFVLEGVDGTITDDNSAQTDAEIQGALTVLENVYQKNSSSKLTLDVTVAFLAAADSGVTADAAITDVDEQWTLLSSVSSSGGACPGTPTDDAMNIFVISALDYLQSGVIGLAAGIPGPFNLHCTAMSGTLAEYQDDGDGTILGFILAHEFGHFLGLYHTSQTGSTGFEIVGNDPIKDTEECGTSDILSEGSIDGCPDRLNLMFPIVENEDDPGLSVGQGNVIKFNPGVLVP